MAGNDPALVNCFVVSYTFAHSCDSNELNKNIRDIDLVRDGHI
jgi:hypothetical protein